MEWDDETSGIYIGYMTNTVSQLAGFGVRQAGLNPAMLLVGYVMLG